MLQNRVDHNEARSGTLSRNAVDTVSHFLGTSGRAMSIVL